MERLSRTMTKKLLALLILNEPVRGLGNHSGFLAKTEKWEGSPGGGAQIA